ncbi:MAG: hypothetical protein JKY49_15045 [Cohaesibacteraceae bacterium]|nr:hypothetical protein [Cohaesibacteraceae bacterium]MBL4876387.1 hypothetical protein [Cohaesibacteraceae bacterium]
MDRMDTITWFGNRSRIQKLNIIRNDFVFHCNGVSECDDEKQAGLRTKINSQIHEICDILHACGGSPQSGRTGFHNNFKRLISRYFLYVEINGDTTRIDGILDKIEIGTGAYSANTKRSVLRIFNPFYYVGLLVSLPFKALTTVGFDGSHLEETTTGKFVKLITFVATVILPILIFVESHASLVEWLKNIVSWN